MVVLSTLTILAAPAGYVNHDYGPHPRPGYGNHPLDAANVEPPRSNETFAEAVRRIRIGGPAD